MAAEGPILAFGVIYQILRGQPEAPTSLGRIVDQWITQQIPGSRVRAQFKSNPLAGKGCRPSSNKGSETTFG